MPHVEWRGSKCRVKWWAGEYLPNGRKKYETQSGFEDEKAAYDFGLDREHDVRHGTFVRSAKAVVLMREYCWAWHEAQELRPASLRSYKSIINSQIIPYWGNKRVSEIDAFEYDAWRKALKARAHRGEISDTYAEDILGVFRLLMADAVTRYQYRTVSPVPPKQPHRGKYRKKKRAKKRPLEMGTLYQLATNAYMVWGFTGWVYIWHAAFTGMRPAEMYGLQRIFTCPTWPASDPDLDRRRESVERYAGVEPMPAVRVEHQYQWVEGKKTLVEPKYESSRTLVLPPFLTQMHQELAASHSSRWTFRSILGGDLLGARFDRDYWAPIRGGAEERTLRKDFLRPAIPAVEVMEGKPIYLLRHGHKEWLDEDGHSRIATEARMGHELAGVEGLYGNVTPKMELRIMETLQARWDEFVGRPGGLWLPPTPKPLPVDES
ncbi:integrase [Streptomyces kronopolitis]|uniref:integrase n=1 Tax=Streptomyces kronopolitis TaxID=1612435 RepID=UPI00341D505E